MVYVIDSLPTKGTNFDQYIVEYIQTSYRRAIEKVAQEIWFILFSFLIISLFKILKQ